MSESETTKQPSLIDRDMDNIIDFDKSDVPLITEAFFINVLFPILNNETDDADFTPWLDVAGSWRRPIDVADETGAVIFRCPALVGANISPKKHDASNSAFDVIEDARRLMANIPRAGNEKIVSGLADRVEPAHDYVKSTKAWNFIYERYDLLDKVRELDVAGSEPATDSNMSASAVEGYDEP